MGKSTAVVKKDNRAGSRLTLLATVAVVAGGAFLFFALLRVGPNSAIQDIFHGDTGAAVYKTLSMSAFYGAASLLLCLAARRLGFYLLLAASVTCCYVAARYGTWLLSTPSVAFVAAMLFMYRGKYHLSSINRHLAVGIAILVYGFAILAALARLRLAIIN